MEKIADSIDIYTDEVVNKEYANWPEQYSWESVSIKKYKALSLIW